MTNPTGLTASSADREDLESGDDFESLTDDNPAAAGQRSTLATVMSWPQCVPLPNQLQKYPNGHLYSLS